MAEHQLVNTSIADGRNVQLRFQDTVDDKRLLIYEVEADGSSTGYQLTVLT